MLLLGLPGLLATLHDAPLSSPFPGHFNLGPADFAFGEPDLGLFVLSRELPFDLGIVSLWEVLPLGLLLLSPGCPLDNVFPFGVWPLEYFLLIGLAFDAFPLEKYLFMELALPLAEFLPFELDLLLTALPLAAPFPLALVFILVLALPFLASLETVVFLIVEPFFNPAVADVFLASPTK